MAALGATYAASKVTRNSPSLSVGAAFSRVGRNTKTGPANLAHQMSFGVVPIVSPTKAISGTVLLAGGAPAAGATVMLIRQNDDQLLATATTDVNGHYLFERDVNDTSAYYVTCFTSATTPQVHGVSSRGRVPA